LRNHVASYLDARLPHREQENLFHRGLVLLSKDDMVTGTRYRRPTRSSCAVDDDEADSFYCDNDEQMAAGEASDMRAIYLHLIYQPDRFRFLELAPCQRVSDTVHILDTLLQLLASADDEAQSQRQQCHALATFKIKLFASASMSMEESYLVKRLLR
jgi:hypothetical protein